MIKIQARARVQVTLDITVPDTWGPDCPTHQIWRQAAESALGLIENGIPRAVMQVVGEPRVTAVLAERAQP